MLGCAFQDLAPGAAKTGIRLMTWQLPTMAKLVKKGREQDSTCTCGAPVESAAHVVLQCPTLSNAITVVHDSVLASIRQALQDHCSRFTQHWCTAAGSLFPTGSLTAEFPALASHLDGPRFVHLERQVPDAVFVHEDGTRIVILELARTDDLLEGYYGPPLAAVRL